MLVFGAPIRCWIAVSAEGLRGEGSHERSVFSRTPVILSFSCCFKSSM